jgi:hypothetical protein
MFTLPFTGSILVYILLGLLIAGLASLVVFLCRRVYRFISRVRGKPVARVGIVGSTFRLLVILLLIAATTATLMLLAFIQSYTAFTHRERIAKVYCTPVPGAKEEMVLKLVTLDSPTGGHLRQFRLFGQQWAIEGHILKWEDWVNFLGLHTMYKLTRVRGRYVRAEDEVARPASAYSLISDQEDPKWRWLYEYGELLPFVHAVYGNTVFNFPSPTKSFEIYVTTSGFMAKEGKGE